ncbi:MAG: tRNA uridine-5-carboxymethylaminomethyl(34) synthesis GTPase MnmE [Proteobacteria bacterium]|nr:tRNA uridine-5-carboxymethylaminomethyl(34) synthesis GTPase MnmE [Pseudomonadota bacterium]
MSSADTIYALATPPGKSGVAVVRVSGPRARQVLVDLTGLAPEPRKTHYAAFTAPKTGQVIDRGLALYFAAPASFTGEEVAECHIHGGMAVIKSFLAVLAEQGLRYAEPGEFTRRAFLNGKMDLLEAEGLADLIEAETVQQKSQAERQMAGELSQYYTRLRTQMVAALAHLEAYIDFPDEDIPESVLTGLHDEVRGVMAAIGEALAGAARGERLREGLSIVILGAPNVGKSSLLNALARRDAAIVSPLAGTTRDLIEVPMDIAGYPAVVVDTAGIRESSELIEQEGIRRALARAEQADIRICVFDAQDWPQALPAWQREQGERTLLVVNKCDTRATPVEGAIGVSVKTGQGMEVLLEAITQQVVAFFGGGGAPMITRARHRAQLLEALKYLENSLKPLPLELTCEELRLAAGAVGKITGVIQVDDVLDVIFSQFCIGK